MIVIVCLDNACGMLFHHRRQSRDKAVFERIQEICAGKKLWMDAYSSKLYGKMEYVDTAISEDFLLKAGRGEYSLVETKSLDFVEDKIEELIVFFWNRTYPADFFFDLDLTKWEKTKDLEFSGHSHEKITEAHYKRNEESI